MLIRTETDGGRGLKSMDHKQKRVLEDFCHGKHERLILTEEDETEDRMLVHESHPHSLYLLDRPTSVKCHACGTEDKDFSYACTKCSFWIHRKCALLPNNLNHTHRPDCTTLELFYSFPDMYHTHTYDCDICGEGFIPTDWLYGCSGCRYFAHLKCATTKKPSDELETNIDNLKLMNLPAADHESMLHHLIENFKNNICTQKISTAAEALVHWGHMFQSLTLVGEGYEKIVCDGCAAPISNSALFYRCLDQDCNFFLHKYCATLPSEFANHPASPYHSLKLTCPEPLVLPKCDVCGVFCNTFYYENSLKKIDLRCALLTILPKIKHESHKHPLELTLIEDIPEICNACDNSFRGYGFRCSACKFYVEIRCLMLPSTIQHRYDKQHPILLTYPWMIKHHPGEFFCDICEEEMDPRLWQYQCAPCDISFHPYCVRPVDKFSNVKFGGKLHVDKHHPHPLTFVLGENKKPTMVSGKMNKPNKCVCRHCGQDRDGDTVYECERCDFRLCPNCAL